MQALHGCVTIEKRMLEHTKTVLFKSCQTVICGNSMNSMQWNLFTMHMFLITFNLDKNVIEHVFKYDDIYKPQYHNTCLDKDILQLFIVGGSNPDTEYDGNIDEYNRIGIFDITNTSMDIVENIACDEYPNSCVWTDNDGNKKMYIWNGYKSFDSIFDIKTKKATEIDGLCKVFKEVGADLLCNKSEKQIYFISKCDNGIFKYNLCSNEWKLCDDEVIDIYNDTGFFKLCFIYNESYLLTFDGLQFNIWDLTKNVWNKCDMKSPFGESEFINCDSMIFEEFGIAFNHISNEYGWDGNIMPMKAKDNNSIDSDF